MLRAMPALLLALLFACGALAGAETYTYWIEECTAPCEAGDPELARWAFEAWQREANNAIVFAKSDWESNARFRLHWADGRQNLYGETRPYMVGGKRAAIIYVLPATHVTSDHLLRDAVVYLTCLHETGHALGLEHTDEFADIMYTFANGGDIGAYFGRYRELLKSRADIAKHSGISDADRAAVRALYK
jgi:hypothetical protein